MWMEFLGCLWCQFVHISPNAVGNTPHGLAPDGSLIVMVWLLLWSTIAGCSAGRLATVKRRNPVAVVLLLAAAGCGAGDESSDGDAACKVVVDRWVEIQQDLLDKLATFEPGASDEGRNAAFQGIAAAMFENSRDANTIGCETALASGSDETCARLVDLRASNPDGESALDQHRVACQDE